MISVLIPAYNAARFIAVAIASVLDQEVSCPVEIIVVDDGSTDETAEIVAEIARGAANVRLIQTPNCGVASARNTAIATASAETQFITFLDA
ncbi:MAG: glycosyltransferase, partial [Deltaproteobacteria bacterium]